MHSLALTHLIVLAAIVTAGFKSPRLGWQRSVLAAFLLVWAVLILTAQFLSLFSLLNVTWLFVGVSLIIAVTASAGLRKIRPLRDVSFGEFESPFSVRFSYWLVAFLVVSAAMVLIGDLKLAKGFLPANPDSIVYRFPRVYWYFAEGALTHFSNQGEPRPQFYPFNGAIANLPFVVFPTRAPLVLGDVGIVLVAGGNIDLCLRARPRRCEGCSCRDRVDHFIDS